METKQFYDRKEELEILQSRYRNLKAGEMLVFYGRRRVGKTELIKEFIKTIQKNKLYFYVDVIEKQGILDSLSKAVEEQLKEIRKFSDFSDFLNYLAEKSEEKFVLVLDEFQRFLETAPSFITQLQNYWDQKLKHEKIMILLVGSSTGMIQRITNSKTGALYGRATKIKISPFRYVDFRIMFQELSEEEKIVLYAVFGGTPYYLEKAKKIEGDIHKKIFELFLKKGADLTEEPKNLLEYENVRAHAKYNALLQAAASGKQSIKEIQDFTGIEAHIMPAYIKKLDTLLDILGRKDPILGKGRVGRYCIKDNFFMFWYKFIFPNQTALNLGNYKLVEERIKESLNAYVGRAFEEICMQFLIAYLNKNVDGYTLDFEDIGTWWDRTGEEIDIIAYNKKARKILLGEVKWTNEQTDVALVDALLAKAKRISFAGEYKFLFISKNGFTKRCEHRMKEINALYFDLNKLEQMFERL
ncbi:MAG: DUF234 domain-containing protein [Nanoarchaeota archaeon]